MRFNSDFLDRLRDRLPISQVVGRKVKLTPKGQEQWGLCPFHGEKSPSFKVNDQRGRYHCFGCGKDGDIVRFLMETEGFSFTEAVENLAQEAGLELPRVDPKQAERAEQRKSQHEIMELACQFFQNALREPMAQEARDYLLQRGLKADTLALYRLGYAPPGSQLRAFLAKNKVSDADMQALCLVKKPSDGRPAYDFFRDRIIFPICDRGGKVIAFGGRVMGDGKPKYLNSGDTPLFDKSRTLFGLSQARQAIYAKHSVLVAEGYMDVIALAQAGFRHAVAPLGTALTQDHLSQLWRLAAEPILCLDGDAAGQAAAQRSAVRALPLLKPGQSLRFLALPQGQDPDDFLRDKGAGAFSALEAAAYPLVEQLWRYEINSAPSDTPERRTALWQRLAEHTRLIPDAELSRAYYQHLRAWYDKTFGPKRPQGSYSQRYDQGYTRPANNNAYGQQGYGRGIRRPAGPPLTQRAETLQTRRLEGLLLALCHHPRLLDNYAESLAQLEMPSLGLKKWRDRLLDLALDWPQDSTGLDMQAFECHLEDSIRAYGQYEQLVKAVQSLTPFAMRSASDAAARKGIDDILAVIQEHQARTETKRAQIEQLKQRFRDA